MGSNPDKLFSFQNLLDGLKQCGNFAFLTTPCILLFSLARQDELGDVKNFTNDTDSAAIKAFSQASEKEFKTRITDILDDLLRLGYFKEIPDRIK